VPEGKTHIELIAKARTIGGGTMDVDNESGDPANKSGELPGHFYGWFSGKPEDKAPGLLTEEPVLPIEMITKEVMAKGVFAVVVNAQTFGIKATLKFV
jgi:hypothetical protein